MDRRRNPDRVHRPGVFMTDQATRLCIGVIDRLTKLCRRNCVINGRQFRDNVRE